MLAPSSSTQGFRHAVLILPPPLHRGAHRPRRGRYHAGRSRAVQLARGVRRQPLGQRQQLACRSHSPDRGSAEQLVRSHEPLRLRCLQQRARVGHRLRREDRRAAGALVRRRDRLRRRRRDHRHAGARDGRLSVQPARADRPLPDGNRQPRLAGRALRRRRRRQQRPRRAPGDGGLRDDRRLLRRRHRHDRRRAPGRGRQAHHRLEHAEPLAPHPRSSQAAARRSDRSSPRA